METRFGPRLAQLTNRLRFYSDIINDPLTQEMSDAVFKRIEDLSVPEWETFNKKPILDKNGQPFVLTNDTFPLHITGAFEIFGHMNKVEGQNIFVGIAGEALRNILSQDFDAICEMRFKSQTIQFQYEGEPHNVYVAPSGLVFSSMHQPTKSPPTT